MNVIYCKYSIDRADAFRIKTVISEDEGGKRAVHKYPLSEAAEKHVEGMYKNYLRMCESYEGTGLAANVCAPEEGGAAFEFLEGQTMEARLDELYAAGKYVEALDLVSEYRDILYSLADNTDFVMTDGFREVFGEYEAEDGCASPAVSDIDMVFDNIMLRDKWTVIDYEWTFDFPVPLDFIIYRSIHYYMERGKDRSRLYDLGIFDRVGISEEKQTAYSGMEEHFQSYVAGGRVGLEALKGAMLKPSDDISDLKEKISRLDSENMKLSDYISSLQSRRIWKIYSGCKKIFKRGKE